MSGVGPRTPCRSLFRELQARSFNNYLSENNKGYMSWVGICNLMYPVCNANELLYSHLWSVRPYNIFPRYLINVTIFESTSLNVNCVMILSTF